MLFVDFHKAFGTSSCLENQSTPTEIINILKKTYEGSKVCVKLVKKEKILENRRG